MRRRNKMIKKTLQLAVFALPFVQSLALGEATIKPEITPIEGGDGFLSIDTYINFFEDKTSLRAGNHKIIGLYQHGTDATRSCHEEYHFKDGKNYVAKLTPNLPKGSICTVEISEITE